MDSVIKIIAEKGIDAFAIIVEEAGTIVNPLSSGFLCASLAVGIISIIQNQAIMRTLQEIKAQLAEINAILEKMQQDINELRPFTK